MKRYAQIFTDGSVYKTYGGWAVRVLYLVGDRRDEVVDQQGEIYGGEVSSQRAEMIAIIAGLHLLRQPYDVIIFTDAQPMISQWKRFQHTGHLPTYNDLWIEIRKASAEHKVTMKYVRGHNGNPHNESCDERAKVMSHAAYARSLKRSLS